jgi:hypothetical protein
MKTSVMFLDKNGKTHRLHIPESWDNISIEDILFNVGCLRWFRIADSNINFNPGFVQSYTVLRPEEGIFTHEKR